MSEQAAPPELIELVARACRILGKLELTHAAFGHVSVRLGDTETMLGSFLHI